MQELQLFSARFVFFVKCKTNRVFAGVCESVAQRSTRLTIGTSHAKTSHLRVALEDITVVNRLSYLTYFQSQVVLEKTVDVVHNLSDGVQWMTLQNLLLKPKAC